MHGPPAPPPKYGVNDPPAKLPELYPHPTHNTLAKYSLLFASDTKKPLAVYVYNIYETLLYLKFDTLGVEPVENVNIPGYCELMDDIFFIPVPEFAKVIIDIILVFYYC